MKTKLQALIIAFLMLPISFCLSQTSFAKIEKNFNVRANDLYHDLNETKDTLVLKSDKKINYVYSINRAVKRELSYTVNSNEIKVPLDKLSNGKHVFVVVQSPVRIVFVVKIFGNTLTEIVE